MKKHFLFSALISFALFFASCSGGGHDHHEHDHHASEADERIDIDPDLLVMVDDPICQMSMKEYPIADTATYNGQLYGFCSKWCKGEFLKNPGAHLE